MRHEFGVLVCTSTRLRINADHPLGFALQKEPAGRKCELGVEALFLTVSQPLVTDYSCIVMGLSITAGPEHRIFGQFCNVIVGKRASIYYSLFPSSGRPLHSVICTR